jgi:outer membrane protein
MKAVKMSVMIVALTTVLGVGPALAQATPPPQNPPAQPPAAQTPPPAGQTPPPAGQTPPPAGQKPPATPAAPAAQPTPPKPFPEGAKIAFIDPQVIASGSVEGKAATARIQELTKKKTAEIQQKQKQAQDLQTKLQQGGTVLSDAARGQAEKDLQRLQRELQGMQEDANAEVQELQQQLQADFLTKLNPIIDQVATEKGLHLIFSTESGILWGFSGLDLSQEVIKRFDAAAKTPVKK